MTTKWQQRLWPVSRSSYMTRLNRSKSIQTWLKASFTWVVSCRRFCPLLASISTTGENSILLYCNQCFLRLLHRCKKVCTKLFFRGSILSLNTSNVRLMMTMWNNFAIVPSSTQQLQLLLAWMSGQLQVNVFSLFWMLIYCNLALYQQIRIAIQYSLVRQNLKHCILSQIWNETYCTWHCHRT